MDIGIIISLLSAVATIVTLITSLSKLSRSVCTKEDIRPLTDKLDEVCGEVGKLKERMSVVEYICKKEV